MMEKQFKLVKPSDVGDVQRPPIDWTLCILCRRTTSESLKQPWRGRGRGSVKGTETAVGYRSFEENLLKFSELGKIPLNVCPDKLNDGSGIAETLHKNNAQWHKSCRDLFCGDKLERQMKHAPSEETSADFSSPKKLRRSFIPDIPCAGEKEPLCFFCDGEAGPEGLHSVSTLGMDSTVRMYATKLRDTKLLAKLSTGDMIALEAKYHKDCLSRIYTRYRQAEKNKSSQSASAKSSFSTYESIALAELISYIEERTLIDKTVPVFRLADLASVYGERLKELSSNSVDQVHSTRLKERLLLHCPYLKAVNKGRDVLLTYDTAIGDAIMQACSDEDMEALQLARAAKVIRKDIFKYGHSFSGSLCGQSDNVPNALFALVNMILNGQSIKSQTHKAKSAVQAAQTISELMVFNSIRDSNKPRTTVQHNKEREVPVPMYLGLKIHAKTRKRGLVDRLHNLGLSRSYDRVLSISSTVATSVIKRFESDGVVCPPQLKRY